MSAFAVGALGTAGATIAQAATGGQASTAPFAAQAVAAQAVAAPAAPRAMWVWDTSTPAATVDLAVSRGIGQLYAAVPPHVDSSPELASLIDLSRRARAAGLRVDALGGDPGWVDNPTRVVDSWLRPALATGLFTGVHADIEPYTGTAWQTKQATVVKKYLATLDTLRTSAGSAPLEADIPFWFDGVAANGSTLDREVLRRTAGVTVMAYRNLAAGPDGSVALSAAEVQAGTQLGRPVRVGQETTFLGDGPADTKQTFFGQTGTQFEAQLSAIAGAFGESPGFAGIAIHDASGYAALAP
ncbi:hypothetical protein [Pedococcus sp. 5OH_020]|uniref:hypothetical protein n=1 Tax=Pedococcus sp. 5OH_020 TaxID=2989814 RepID=UPI0022E9F6E8|nr:hypothetical protein [Pedococcus sp. 5OH_020]